MLLKDILFYIYLKNLLQDRFSGLKKTILVVVYYFRNFSRKFYLRAYTLKYGQIKLYLFLIIGIVK